MVGNFSHSSLTDPVITHVNTGIPKLLIDQTVGDAIDGIRQNPTDARIIYFYVVNADNVLQGVVPTRRLLLNSPATFVRDIMVKNVISIPDTATILEACEYFMKHRFLAFPVVDSSRKLLGLVDIELYTEELSDVERREGNEQLFQLIGVHYDDLKQTSTLNAFTNRFPWLIANIAGGILAAFLSGMFEVELQKAVALALFIPVVLALAESVSIQSASLALRALSNKDPSLKDIFKKLRSEFVTGSLLGITCGISVAVVALLWLGHTQVTICLLGGIAGSVTCAAVIGTAMPNLIRLFNREPQVAAGPLALATTDMVTLLIYFTLARLLLN